MPEPTLHYETARILSLKEEGTRDIAGAPMGFRVYRARILSGAEKGEEVELEQNDAYLTNQLLVVVPGSDVVIAATREEGGQTYAIVDSYRLDALSGIAIFFLILAVLVGRWRGFTSVVGLLASALVIVLFIVPQIMAGANPLSICLIGTFVIAFISLYLAHGFNRRTTIALVATFVTLAISVVMAISFVSWSKLLGMGSEDALYLISTLPNVSLRGLLLGGMLLGLLGVLDDVTTGQVAIVEELKAANPSFGFKELYRRGLSVGREHIASLVNTLFLAYAGVALPLLLLFWSSTGQPLWMVLNSELVAEEIVRTLVGSSALVLAVPIATALAAYCWRNEKK